MFCYVFMSQKYHFSGTTNEQFTSDSCFDTHNLWGSQTIEYKKKVTVTE